MDSISIRTMNMNEEELKTCLGQMLADLRGNWGDNYEERIHLCLDLCSLLEEKYPDTVTKLKDIRETAAAEFERMRYNDHDGRYFRDECDLYNYCSPEGSTESVQKWVNDNCTFPEYRTINLNDLRPFKFDDGTIRYL